MCIQPGLEICLVGNEIINDVTSFVMCFCRGDG